MAEGIAISIASTIAEYLVEPVISQFRYVFCFNSIIDDLKNQNESLRLIQERVKHKVGRALRNGEEVETDVQNWLTEVDNVMAEVELLKSETEVGNGQCPNWSCRYWSSKKASKKAKTIMELKEKGKFDGVSHRPPLQVKDFFSSREVMAFEATKVAFNQIIEALKDDRSKIIGVYGMGGVGKTTLVKEVAVKAKEFKLFDQVVMAVVSQTPNLRKIQGQIADLLGLKFEEESEYGRAGRLRSRLMNESKILVILDDVWEVIDLEAIGIPFDHMGCRIIVTTRRQQVCTSMRIQKKILLDTLSEDEAWSLFKINAGIGDGSPTLNDIALEVAKECKGLPIAIVTVGRALRDRTPEEWCVASQQLQRARPVDIEDVDTNVYACLKLSYDYLKEETKFCFLLCSLFPEDYEINIEDLVLFGLGLGLYDVDSIEEARNQARMRINNLKASCLLLDSGKEECVKMHDMVRDVALWISSQGGENVFFVRTSVALKRWPNIEGLQRYTAISLMANSIQDLSDKLVCSQLKILLLGENKGCIKFLDGFFEGVRALKVLDLSNSHISWDLTFSLPQSLQFLTDLRTLYMKKCNMGDISVLGKLKRLEFLSFHGSHILKFPKIFGELKMLKLLDLSCCQWLVSIPPAAIQGLSRLEELYIGSSSFKQWKIKGAKEGRSNASLSDLNSLVHLAKLSLDFEDVRCLPKGFTFPKLLKYDISMDCSSRDYPTSRTLSIKDVDASSANAFKSLLPIAEYITLSGSRECCLNIVPNIDQGGLNELISLTLKSCRDTECLIDTTQRPPEAAFSNLLTLCLCEMDCLTTMCHGLPPNGFLHKLQILEVKNCGKVCSIFPAKVLQKLQNLEEMTVYGCDELPEVFHIERPDIVGENVQLLSSLKTLRLSNLRELKFIWKGPTHVVRLHNLTVLCVTRCRMLRHVFTPIIVSSLLQLQSLTIQECKELEQIIVEDENDQILTMSRHQHQLICFPKLKDIVVEGCNNLKSLFPMTVARGLPQLKNLQVRNSSRLKQIFEDVDGEDVDDGEEIDLPEITNLKLIGLESLVRFCPEGYFFRFPMLNLKYLTVNSCPILTTDFTVDQDQYVWAE